MGKIQKLLANPFVRIAVFLLIYFIAIFSVRQLYNITNNLPNELFDNYVAYLLMGMNIFIAGLIANSLIEAFRKSSKWYYFGLKFEKKGLLDFLHGFAMVAIVCGIFIGVYYLLGARIGNGYDITGKIPPQQNFIVFQTLMLFIYAMQEEMLARGVILQALIQQFGSKIAIIVTSLFFTIGHFVNPDINAIAMVNIFLAGILLAMMYIKTNSLFLPISFHFFWNFMQAFTLSSPISGVNSYNNIGQLYWIIPNSKLNTVILGGNFGIEAGVITTVILLLLILYTNKAIKPSKAMEKLLKIRYIEEQKLIGKYNEEN